MRDGWYLRYSEATTAALSTDIRKPCQPFCDTLVLGNTPLEAPAAAISRFHDVRLVVLAAIG